MNNLKEDLSNAPIVGNLSDAAASEIRIDVVRDYDEVERLRPFWTSWQDQPNADIDFYLWTMRSLPQVERPHILVAYRADTPEAILVGRLERGSISAKIGYRSIVSVKSRMMTFIRGGYLGNTSPQNSDLLVRAIFSSLRKGEADVAFISHINAESSIVKAAEKLQSFVSRDYLPGTDIHRRMVLPSSGHEVYQHLSPKVRKNLRWQEKKLLNAFEGSVDVRCFRADEDIPGMCRDLEMIAEKTYQRGLGVGFRDSPPMRERLRLVAEKGWMRNYVLYLRNIPVAFWMCTLYRGTLHSDFMGYDPAYAKLSPGMFLIMKVIEELCSGGQEESVQGIDFGLGDAQYKEVLGTSEGRDITFFLFSLSAKGIGLNLIRTPPMLLDRLLSRFVHKLGIANRIKRIWRDSVIREEPKPGLRKTDSVN
jgi:Acetyltransferase (GNAT) domain